MSDLHEPENFPAVESRLSVHLLRQEFNGLDPAISLHSVDDPDGANASGAPVAPRSEHDAAKRYVRLGELGQGGMGTVYKVLDTDLHRRLALKVVRSQKPSGDGSGSPPREILTRFLEEAQVTGQLDHPGIVPLHEIGVDARGRVYFTMRLVKGRHLGEIFKLARSRSEGWSRDTVLPLFVKVCEAMSYAHSKGVVHRDLKPENIMVGRFGEAYVMDWGLAKVRGRQSTVEKKAAEARASQTFIQTDRSTPESGAARHTQEGTVFGTLQFMSPEQARGDIEHIDARSDVYSIGAMLYELLTGQAPYSPPDSNVAAHVLLRWVLDGPPKPVLELAPDAPPDLAAICAKCMERDPAKRYQDMHALGEDLRLFTRGRPVSANPLSAAQRTKRWCRRNPIVTAFVATMTIGVGIALWSLSNVGESLVQQAAMDSASMKAAILEDVNALYSAEVVSRVDREHVMVTHDYKAHPGAIPLPATFLTVLGEKISSEQSGVRVRHYSDFPFNFRKDGGAHDEFERMAMTNLRADPKTPVYRFEDVEGKPVLRYATARIMKESCVKCHNAHPDSPKTDWKVGDVRGVLEIIRPLDRDIQRTRAGMRGTLLLLGGVGALMLAFGAFILVRQHRIRD